ncbi:hypothetical protein [Lacimicrobium sp. SS2-24]|uniref:hypothetical protein n=1 Tax=Lacimicrobium sp. SS2-24 TaxID=2005569 RepID=UPI000B4AFDF8|nr:hypothetical protein [Lacimicrobium sp. SS2-24]
MNLLERYIYSVRHYLPEPLREDVGRELKANIEDELEAMAEQQPDTTETQRQEQILQQFGHPGKIAANYHQPTPLVNAALMPIYIKVLGTTLGLLFALHTLELSLGHVAANDFNLIRFILQLGLGFLDTVVWTFTSVTLIFYGISGTNTEYRWLGYNTWKPGDLAQIHHPWQQIKSSDTFTEMVTNAFLLLVIWQPLWRSAESMAASGYAFSASFASLFPLLTALLVLSLLFNLWCLVKPYWTRTSLSINVVQNLLYAAVLLYLASLDELAVIRPGHDSIVHIDDVNSSLSVGLTLIALYLFYEVFRDTRRLRALASGS